MFNKREILNRKQHAGLRFATGKGFGFAANLMSIPAVSAEVEHMAREYVIVFDREQTQMHALLGSAQAFNGYVNDHNQWLARYIPANIRAYPFSPAVIAGQETSSEGKHQVAITLDPEAPQFNDANGELIIDEQGKPTELFDKVQNAITSLYQDSIRTSQQIAQLNALGLLIERPIEIKRNKVSLDGFRIIDTDRLSQLSSSDLATLRDSGALMLIYGHLISLSNVKDSPVVRIPKTETIEPTANVTAIQEKDFFTDEDFNLDFSKFQS